MTRGFCAGGGEGEGERCSGARGAGGGGMTGPQNPAVQLNCRVTSHGCHLTLGTGATILTSAHDGPQPLPTILHPRHTPTHTHSICTPTTAYRGAVRDGHQSVVGDGGSGRHGPKLQAVQKHNLTTIGVAVAAPGAAHTCTWPPRRHATTNSTDVGGKNTTPQRCMHQEITAVADTTALDLGTQPRQGTQTHPTHTLHARVRPRMEGRMCA